MKVEIYGNTLASASAAFLSHAHGHQTTWFSKSSTNPGFRPVRLHSEDLKLITECTRHSLHALPSLLKAQPIQGFTTLLGRPLQDPWAPTFRQDHLWVDETALLKELKRAASGSSIRLLETEVYPRFMGNTANITIVDAEDAELHLWSPSFFEAAGPETTISYSLHILFAKNPRQRPGSGKIFRLRGCLGLLEPSSSCGSVLSFWAEKKEFLLEIQSALFRKQTIRSNLPAEISALLALNPSAPQRLLSHKIGRSRVAAPGIFPIGRSIGCVPPETNLQEGLAFNHLRDLIPALRSADPEKQGKIFKQSERWTSAQRTRFERILGKANLWKQILNSDMDPRVIISAHGLLPPFLRKFLASPL